MESIELPPGEIQLWTIFHHLADSKVESMERHLSPDEIALREKFDRDRGRRFTTTRATLRLLLSAYTGIPPRDVRFRYGPRGKPFLLEPGQTGAPEPRVQFNLSDSNDVVVLGFASDREIGVDIEKIRPVEKWRKIATRFFGDDEAGELSALDGEARDKRFMEKWVMEEARIKATGQGIWSRRTPEAAALSYKSIYPAPGYCGAIAAPHTDWIICLCGVQD